MSQCRSDLSQSSTTLESALTLEEMIETEETTGTDAMTRIEEIRRTLQRELMTRLILRELRLRMVASHLTTTIIIITTRPRILARMTMTEETDSVKNFKIYVYFGCKPFCP